MFSLCCVPRRFSSLSKNLRKGTNGRPFCCYLPEASQKWSFFFFSSTVCFSFQLYCGCFHRQKRCGVMFVEGLQACSSSLWLKNVKSICGAVMEADKVNVTDTSPTLDAGVSNGNLKHQQQYTSNFTHLTCKIWLPVSAFSGQVAVVVRCQHLAFKSCAILYTLASIFHNLDNNMDHIWLFIFATRFSVVILI